MNAPTTTGEIVRNKMLLTLEQQKASFYVEGECKYRTRINRLERAIGMLVNNQERIANALCADYGHRSMHQSLLTDVASSILPLKYAKSHLARWMKPQSRRIDFRLSMFGAKATAVYRPLGVVGLISPWNFPVQLTFAPLAGILAAGNRVMIKPSEFTPRTSELMHELFSTNFDPTEVSVFTGGAEVGQIFSSLPFNHLLFTGNGHVGRHVMSEAARNLVPVTLELGGKSPVVLGRGAPFKLSAKRIMLGKLLNAGQICVAPDYLWISKGQTEEFIKAAQQAVEQMFPSLLGNPDYTSIINEQHYYRLHSYLEDAHAKGAQITTINPANEDFSQQPHYKMVPTIVSNVHDSMKLMQDEIFGPILPIKEYDTIDDVIHYMNHHDRPLALYYFGNDKNEERQLFTRTIAGSFSVNDVVSHVGQEAVPLGGVGSSGMGRYKGYDGFVNFSHLQPIFQQSRLDVAKIAGLTPPWGAKISGLLKRLIRH